MITLLKELRHYGGGLKSPQDRIADQGVQTFEQLYGEATPPTLWRGAGSAVRMSVVPATDARNDTPSSAIAAGTPSTCMRMPPMPGPMTSVAAPLVACAELRRRATVLASARGCRPAV
jgi:hypothetical protein